MSLNVVQLCWFVHLLCFECSFCIIEGPETVQDFAKMELQEIQDNIRSRRNKIFLHMEEVSFGGTKFSQKGMHVTIFLHKN